MRKRPFDRLRVPSTVEGDAYATSIDRQAELDETRFSANPVLLTVRINQTGETPVLLIKQTGETPVLLPVGSSETGD